MTTSTHTADSLDTVEAIVSRAILTGQLLPSMRAWALHLGNKDRAALLSFLAGAPELLALAELDGLRASLVRVIASAAPGARTAGAAEQA